MTAAGLLPVALAAVGGLVVVLAAWVAGWRAARQHRERRRQEIAAPWRRSLLVLATGDEPDDEAVSCLAGLDRRQWAALEPSVLALLDKVRGASRAALTGLLRQRGAFDRAVAGSRSPRSVTRARAAHVLGLLETPDALEPLCRLVADRDRDVRTVAARGLGRIGRGEAARTLVGALGADRAVPPRLVAQALLRLGEVATPVLVEAARDPRPAVAATAVDVLGLGAAIAASPALTELVGPGHDPEVRIRSARALGRIGMPSALPGLLSATAPGEEPVLRRVAARALGDLGSGEPSTRSPLCSPTPTTGWPPPRRSPSPASARSAPPPWPPPPRPAAARASTPAPPSPTPSSPAGGRRGPAPDSRSGRQPCSAGSWRTCSSASTGWSSSTSSPSTPAT